jgi:signal transduction histidine kinase
MLKFLPCWLICFFLAMVSLRANDYTEKEGREAWETLKRQPLTEISFRAVCDLMQDIGKTNINLSYTILAAYTPMVKATNNRRWLHVLLMGWAKAKESLYYFEEAEGLYRQARENAAGDARLYDEALVGTALMYAEWGRMDSLDKYVAIGKAAAQHARDRENLSFLYTFASMAHLTDTLTLGRSLEHAIALATGLSNKNALFTARYNYAVMYCQHNPQKQVTELGDLLELAKDPSLNHRPRLYERTDFYFRNPTASIYYQLMQVNLLLTDYDNAWKFAELFYDVTVKPNPSGVQAPYFNAEMAIIKAYQGEFDKAGDFLQQSRTLFRLPEEKIPSSSFFLASGMIAEHDKDYRLALHDYEIAYKKGSTEGLHLMPPDLYYAHELILSHQLKEAEEVLKGLRAALPVRTYSAYGYFYYKHYAELLKAKGDFSGYGKALETYYAIRDSLTSLNHYRAIQEIEAKVRLRDKERQIVQLNEENEARIRNSRRDRVYFAIFITLSALTVLLLIGYARNQYLRKRQAQQIALQREALQENKLLEMGKLHRIQIMQGAIDAEENERHKIADQLHDEVGGMLSLATLNLSSTLEKGREDAQAEERLQKTQEILFSVSTTIRELSHRLTPLVIEKYGFRKAVEDMIYTINLSEKLKLEGIVIGFEETGQYPVAFLNDLYRMLQELMHNILKHANADHAMLELVEHAGQVSILVEDNGIGIDLDKSVKGKGLDTIRSKIAYLNGHMEISKKWDHGTLIVIELPTDKADL